VRLVTYNILDGGLDGGRSDRWQPLLEVITGAHPDVLVLNECNHFDAAGHAHLHRMERETGLRGLLAPSATGYHVAVFVAPDVQLVEHHPQPGPHHSSLRVRGVRGGLPFTLVAVHLCPFGGQTRLVEAEALTRVASADEWVFIAGDMNALSPSDAQRYDPNRWLPRRRVRHLLAGGQALDTRALGLLEASGLVDLGRHVGCTTPTVLTPLAAEHESYQVRLDHVFASAPVLPWVRSVEVIRSDAAQRASDHYPVVVDIDDAACRAALDPSAVIQPPR
jgi:endonuclease/exonuclease/phosphatase family metal-dependent hydrolase